jgi:predicted RNase H-like nuclease (RuvC/YqgF family)
MDVEMKEQREMQTHIDELNSHIKAQSDEIDRLRRDAARYRWLNKYTAQLFMVTEAQMNYEVDRAMSGGVR